MSGCRRRCGPRSRSSRCSACCSSRSARHRCAVDVVIHAPARRSDERNHHAHLLMTTRRLNADGLTEKTRELDDLKTGEVTRWRERWATLVNERLAEHGHTDRVDHRSLEAQVLDRDATFHKGPAVTAIERRGESAHVVERVRDDLTERLQNAAELGRLERESQELARSIIDTAADLRAALVDRDQDRVRTVAVIRRDAQVAWLASRIAHAGTVPQSPQTARTLDLSGDVASARREARERWLADRQGAQRPEIASLHADAHGKSPARIVLPDDDHAR